MTTMPIERNEPKRRVSPRLNPGTTYEAPPATPNSNRMPLVTPHMISQEAVNYLTDKVWDCTTGVWAAKEILVEEATNTDHQNNLQDVDVEHFCAAVVHPETGETITQYKKLINDPNPTLRRTWKTAFGKEVGRLAQGDTKTKTKGKNCIFAMTHDEIKKMYAKGKKPMYARVVVDFRPQKEDPN